MSSLAGKTYWLIGASEGIGQALAQELARRGATLMLSARRTKSLEDLVATLPERGHRALALDVTLDDSIANAWELLGRENNIPYGVIYNAGTYDPLSCQEFNLERTLRMMEVNFTGALCVLSRCVPAFVARKAGHLVLVGSVAAYSGLPKALGYGASKAALLHLAENLRVDLDGCGVKVQLVSPGFVKTRLTEKNEFPMPFIITPESAAKRIADGMETSRFEIHFPKRFSLLLKVLRMLPYSIYFALVGRL